MHQHAPQDNRPVKNGSHGRLPYKDFVVPLNLLKKGWNNFKFQLQDTTKPVTIMRLELALYP